MRWVNPIQNEPGPDLVATEGADACSPATLPSPTTALRPRRRRNQPLNDPCHGWQLPTQGDDVLGCGAGVVKGSDAELGADSGEGYEGVPDVDGKRAAADCELFCDFGLGRPVAQ